MIESGAELLVMTLDGDVPPEFGAIPAGRYLVRVHARGRDTHTGLDVSEPTETYLLTVTPSTGPVGTITTLADADTAHSQTSRMPVIDYDRVWVPGPDGGHIEVARDSPEAQAVYAGRDRWGGHPPTGRLTHDTELRILASVVAIWTVISSTKSSHYPLHGNASWLVDAHAGHSNKLGWPRSRTSVKHSTPWITIGNARARWPIVRWLTIAWKPIPRSR
ncbi:hypothetical protein [Nocardia rhamnosiphila]